MRGKAALLSWDMVARYLCWDVSHDAWSNKLLSWGERKRRDTFAEMQIMRHGDELLSWGMGGGTFISTCYWCTLVYCSRLFAWWSTQSGLETLLSSLITRRWVRLQTLWRYRLKDLSIDEMIGAWCIGVYRGLPVGFLLLWYSVLLTVVALSLLYLLFKSWFICSRRWCIDKLGVFHANKTSMCLDPHLN